MWRLREVPWTVRTSSINSSGNHWRRSTTTIPWPENTFSSGLLNARSASSTADLGTGMPPRARSLRMRKPMCLWRSLISASSIPTRAGTPFHKTVTSAAKASPSPFRERSRRSSRAKSNSLTCRSKRSRSSARWRPSQRASGGDRSWSTNVSIGERYAIVIGINRARRRRRARARVLS